MTEPTTAPDDNPAPVPATERASRPTARWHQRRFPLVAMVGVLLVGCFLGAGVTAFGALVVSLVHHGHDDRMERRGDPRPHRVEPWGGRGEGPRGFGGQRGPGGGHG
ncbi:hypothetical protein, partial [Luedemannella flava]|uniref:hypothetical protein n=1 Tax=Luedemannella flava TaxID=349316 RepID=UPI0031D69F5B